MAVRVGKRKSSLRREKVEWADRGRVRPYRVIGKRKSSLRREKVGWADRGRVRPYRVIGKSSLRRERVGVSSDNYKSPQRQLK
jgi:hypothetical protein